MKVLILATVIVESIMIIALRARYLKILRDYPNIRAEKSVFKITLNWLIRKKDMLTQS